MKKFILLGELGEKFGGEHRFDVKNVAEGIRAFRANFKDFESYLVKSSDRGVGYKFNINSEPLVDEKELTYPLGNQGDIIITPAIFGSGGAEKILVGAILVAVAIALPAGAAAIPYLVGIGVSLAAGGVIQLLSPIPKLSNPYEKNIEDTPSYYFNGAVNTSAAGEPVPILYGEMIVGSAVISAGILIEELE